MTTSSCSFAEILGNLITRNNKNNITTERLEYKLSLCAGEISQSISEWFKGNYLLESLES